MILQLAVAVVVERHVSLDLIHSTDRNARVRVWFRYTAERQQPTNANDASTGDDDDDEDDLETHCLRVLASIRISPTNATKHDNSINGKTPKRIQIVENVCVPACAVAI